MSIVIRDKHTAQIRVSKRGTKKYFSKTVHIPDGLTKRERDRFLEDEERKFENECKGGCKNANIAFAVFLEQDYFVNNPRKDDYKSMLSRTLPQIGHMYNYGAVSYLLVQQTAFYPKTQCFPRYN